MSKVLSCFEAAAHCFSLIFALHRYRTGERPGDDWVLLPDEDGVCGDGRCGQPVLEAAALSHKWSEFKNGKFYGCFCTRGQTDSCFNWRISDSRSFIINGTRVERQLLQKSLFLLPPNKFITWSNKFTCFVQNHKRYSFFFLPNSA